MKELKFKTNINCGNCVKRITPFIDKIAGIESWSVDVDDMDKVLTVKAEDVTAQQVIDAVSKVGFDIEEIQ